MIVILPPLQLFLSLSFFLIAASYSLATVRAISSTRQKSRSVGVLDFGSRGIPYVDVVSFLYRQRSRPLLVTFYAFLRVPRPPVPQTTVMIPLGRLKLVRALIGFMIRVGIRPNLVH